MQVRDLVMIISQTWQLCGNTVILNDGFTDMAAMW